MAFSFPQGKSWPRRWQVALDSTKRSALVSESSSVSRGAKLDGLKKKGAFTATAIFDHTFFEVIIVLTSESPFVAYRI